MKRKFNSDTVYTAAVYVTGILAALVWIYPLIFVVSASFSSPEALLNGEVFLFPKGPTLEAYRYIFQNSGILTGYKNTIFYSLFGTVYNMILTICAAYPLSRPDLKGRNLLTVMITFTMFFGGGMEGMSFGSTMTDSLIYESLKYGVIVVSTLPMLIGYLLVQKSFKKGIMMGSLKG